MPSDTRLKKFLFVDDDPEYLALVQEMFSGMSRGSWEIATASNHAQALAHLQTGPLDVVVLDVSMPVMDGIQFLRLLRRTHPGQQVVMLTATANEETRKACLEQGASLFLEKLLTPEGFAPVFAALDALAEAVPQTGFQGMMRRVGLQEVLQMECLGRKSSVLEVFAGKTRGRIFISDGAIVHTESGTLQGEVALYGLLALQGGQFNLLPFTEPPRRTISAHYEFLLMEAARLTDEGTGFFEAASAGTSALEPTSESAPEGLSPLPATAAEPARIQEVLLCSGAGELLYDSGCLSLEGRLALLAQVEQQAAQLGSLLPAGPFDRLEIVDRQGRAVCQVQPHMRLFVRGGTNGSVT